MKLIVTCSYDFCVLVNSTQLRPRKCNFFHIIHLTILMKDQGGLTLRNGEKRSSWMPRYQHGTFLKRKRCLHIIRRTTTRQTRYTIQSSNYAVANMLGWPPGVYRSSQQYGHDCNLQNIHLRASTHQSRCRVRAVGCITLSGLLEGERSAC